MALVTFRQGFYQVFVIKAFYVHSRLMLQPEISEVAKVRDLIKDFVAIISRTLPITEYEFGSLQVLGQAGYADLRPFSKARNM